MLTHLKEQLGQLSHPNLVELGTMLKEIANIDQQITPFVKEPDQYAYGRNVIYRSEHAEIIAILIPSQCSTSIHDHGISIGTALVVQGVLTNRIFKAVSENLATEKAKRIIGAGQLCYSPRGMIHQIINSKKEPLISLHAYSPPLQNMKIYQTAKNELLASSEW